MVEEYQRAIGPRVMAQSLSCKKIVNRLHDSLKTSPQRPKTEDARDTSRFLPRAS